MLLFVEDIHPIISALIRCTVPVPTPSGDLADGEVAFLQRLADRGIGPCADGRAAERLTLGAAPPDMGA